MARRPDRKIVDLDAHRLAHRDARSLAVAQLQAEGVAASLQTIVGALQDIRLVLQRMRALALLAAHDGVSAAERHAIQVRLNQLAETVDQIAADARRRTDGSGAADLPLHVGADALEAIALTLAALTPAALGLIRGGQGERLSVGDDVQSALAVSALEAALETVSTYHAELGALVVGFGVLSENLAAVRSRITDAESAAVLTTLLKAQILRQPAAALLAQAHAMQGILLRFPAGAGGSEVPLV